MAIIATKSGWLIAATILRETPKAFIVEYSDEKGKERRINKNDHLKGVFNSVDEALEWMEEGVKCLKKK